MRTAVLAVAASLALGSPAVAQQAKAEAVLKDMRGGRGAAPGGEGPAAGTGRGGDAPGAGAGTPAGPSDVTLFLTDYQAEDGVMLPRRLVHVVDGNPLEEWTFKKIKINPQFKTGFFDKK